MIAARTYFQPYAIAFAAVGCAALLRLLLDPVLGDQLPFYLFYFAVLAASVRGGLGPGLAALFMGFLAASYFFSFPRFSISLAGSEDVLGAFRYVSIGTAMVLGGAWAGSLRKRWLSEVHARKLDHEKAEQVLRAKEQTVNTLASIGDGLITVDMNSRVLYMNSVAEQLSGWTATAAKGQDITQVFRIVDAITRTAVPDPTQRSLREERVVTLPENTVLIGRDGRERAIDDSAAPIRDKAGAISGSVLIFREVPARDLHHTGAFTIGEVELFPAPGEHIRLSTTETMQLQHACRIWLQREWILDGSSARLVALAGFELIVRQTAVTPKPSGIPEVRFLVLYERRGSVK